MNATIIEFWRTATAMLFANLLTVAFVWACWNLSRLEREGRDKLPGQGRGLYLSIVGMCFLFLLGGAFWIYH